MKKFIEKISDRQNLTEGESREIFTALVEGKMDPIEIAALLIGLRTKKEAQAEIVGAARALRSSALDFDRPNYDCADSCGTGGDGAHTINISTATALVAAEMGIPMVKHGNRSISSKCGSADVLELLGVKLDASPEVSRKCLDTTGICFFFAPIYHAGLRHAGPVRKQLGLRTIMNVLGPLVNPAAPAFQVMGVYDESLCTPLAQVLGSLGCKSALVVHGGGLDEIALHGPTRAALFTNGKMEELEISPAQAGLKEFTLDQIKGGNPTENTHTLQQILNGKGSDAHNSAVAINSGALAWISGKASDLQQGTQMAMAALRSGNCMNRLSRFAETSNGS